MSLKVEWVVNNLAELGVKIGNQFFFLYKGESMVYYDVEQSRNMRWRHVGKREFGETCKPLGYREMTEDYDQGQGCGGEWKDLPPTEGSEVVSGLDEASLERAVDGMMGPSDLQQAVKGLVLAVVRRAAAEKMREATCEPVDSVKELVACQPPAVEVRGKVHRCDGCERKLIAPIDSDDQGMILCVEHGGQNTLARVWRFLHKTQDRCARWNSQLDEAEWCADYQEALSFENEKEAQDYLRANRDVFDPDSCVVVSMPATSRGSMAPVCGSVEWLREQVEQLREMLGLNRTNSHDGDRIVTLSSAIQKLIGRLICRTCGCLWRVNADGTHSLYDGQQHPCKKCDNEPNPPLTAAPYGRQRVKELEERIKVLEERLKS